MYPPYSLNTFIIILSKLSSDNLSVSQRKKGKENYIESFREIISGNRYRTRIAMDASMEFFATRAKKIRLLFWTERWRPALIGPLSSETMGPGVDGNILMKLASSW